MALENQQIHTINTDKIFLNNRNDKKTDHIVFETNGLLGENNVEFSNCNVDVKTGFLKAPELRSNNLKDADGNTTITLSSNSIDLHSKTVNNLIVGSGATINAVAVTSANGYASLDAELDALQQQKVSITNHTANKVFVSSSGGGLTTSTVTTTDLNKLPNITISAPLNLDTIETNTTASKAITDLISVTGAVDLDDIKTQQTTNTNAIGINTSARISNTSLIQTNISSISTNSGLISTNITAIAANTAKTGITPDEQNKLGHISVTGGVNLDTIATDTDTNKFKLTGVSYDNISTAGTINLTAGDHDGLIGPTTYNGDINIIAGEDGGANPAGNIVIKQNDDVRIKLIDDDTTIGISTNKLIVDTNVLVDNNPGMEYFSNAFFLLKKRTSVTHWNLVMDQGNNFWSGFYNARSWDCYESSTKYDKDTDGATLFLNYYSHGNVSICENGGKCHIGVTDGDSKCLLHVGADSTYQTNDTGIKDLHDMNSVSYLTEATTQVQNASFFDFRNSVQGYDLSIYAEGMIYTSSYVGASDKRIKKNITEIDDERSLIQLRNLPCVDYEYIDNFKNGEYPTVGFIAQDVAEIMPNCIKKVSDIIPNEMRKLENVAWEEVKDDEGTIKYKLLNQTLEECSYRFYVKKDASSNEIRVELKYPFLFNKKYEQVFCYGKRIDDFLAIDKNKIFAVAFSATQEIDRIQQQHAIEIANIKAELQEEKNKTAYFENKFRDIEAELQKEKNKTVYFEDKLRDIAIRLSNANL